MAGTQRAARQMRDQARGGSIVNITSIGGINAGPGVTAYRASKAGASASAKQTDRYRAAGRSSRCTPAT